MNTNLTTALTEKTNFLLPTMVEGDFSQGATCSATSLKR